MTETPPEDGGGTQTQQPPAEGAGTSPDTTSTESPPTATDATEGTSVTQEKAESGDYVSPLGTPGRSSSANTTTTTIMKAASLPTPAGGTGGPITTVYGKKSAAVWGPLGWAEDASGKPNIASETITVETETVTNADLDDAEAEIIKNDKGLDTWENEGWVAAPDGGGTAATGASAGTPGTFTPSGATPPADVAAMAGLTANPATAWTTGQYVQTATAGAPGEATWSGTDWVGGKAP